MSNTYLEGNFAPVCQEQTVTELPVTGAIPAHLDGRYLRNGPNPVSEVDPAAYHWFMGDGMVHGVRLCEGRAQWYRNRWVRAPHVARELGESSRQIRHRAGAEAIGANTNVISHAGRTIALVEGGNASYQLTDELDTVAHCPADTPPTPTGTRRPASCTRSRTTSAGATRCSTRSSAETGGPAARWTSPSPAAR